jgi:uncharacterized membrane protein (UPF0136 family)
MLRAWFAIGAAVILGAWVIALTLMEIGRWAGLDLAVYASTFLWILVLVWVCVMLGGMAYRVVRFFAKPPSRRV